MRYLIELWQGTDTRLEHDEAQNLATALGRANDLFQTAMLGQAEGSRNRARDLKLYALIEDRQHSGFGISNDSIVYIIGFPDIEQLVTEGRVPTHG